MSEHGEKRRRTDTGPPEAAPPEPIPVDEDDADDDLVIVDEDGDLLLRVGSGPSRVTYAVCARTVARASPVFKRMLFGRFAEGRPQNGENWIVALPEEGPDAFGVILDILHGWFDKVPEALALERLANLLVITEKYDITGLVRPWVRSWLDGVRDKDDVWLLSIAWQLGDAELFESMVQNIILGSSVGPDGDLRYGTGPIPELVMHLSPPDLFGDIAELRERLVVSQLDPYVQLYGTLTREGWCGDITDRSYQPRCDSQVLGSLVIGLLRKGVQITAPDPFAEYRGTMNRLQAAVQGLKLFAVHDSGQGCQRSLEKLKSQSFATTSTLLWSSSVVRPQHQERLQKQGEKTGLARASSC